MAKTIDEKILEAKKKRDQYDNQMKKLLQTQQEEKRKARTRRLIERGALLESLMGVNEDFTDEQIRDVLAAALSSDAGRKALFSLRDGQAKESAKTEETSTGDET